MTNIDTLSLEELKKLRKIVSASQTMLIVGLGAGMGIGSYLNSLPLELSFLGVNFANMILYKNVDKHLFEKTLNAPETEEEIELIKIYNEIMKDIVDLTKSLDNKTVIEHHMLLLTLIRNDFLNYNCKQEAITNLKNERKILSAISLNGHGVCRHNALAEKEFMEALGFKSTLLLGEHCELTKEEYGHVLLSKEEIKPKKEIIINHAICMTNDKENSHYLDISCFNMYSRKGNMCLSKGKSIFQVDEDAIKQDGMRIGFRMKKLKEKESLPIYEIKHEEEIASKKIMDNADMITYFYYREMDKLERAEELIQKQLIKQKNEQN